MKSAVVGEASKSCLGRATLTLPGSYLIRARDLVGCIEGPGDLSIHKRQLERFGKWWCNENPFGTR